MSAGQNLRRIFFWPAVLALLTVAGLISALVADGAWDALSWLLLLIPVALGIVLGWFASSNR